MKYYGYARVSTKKQKIDRQITNIRSAYPSAEIITEYYTGTKMNRTKWKELLKKVRIDKKNGEDVTIVFDSVSRMSRNAAEGWNTYIQLFNENIELVFLKESTVNTAIFRQATDNKLTMLSDQFLESSSKDIEDMRVQATGELISGILAQINIFLTKTAKAQVYAAFQDAENEARIIRERTKEGLAAAKKNRGVVPGSKLGTSFVTKKERDSLAKIRKNSRSFLGTNTDEEVMAICKISANTLYKYKRIIRKIEEEQNGEFDLERYYENREIKQRRMIKENIDAYIGNTNGYLTDLSIIEKLSTNDYQGVKTGKPKANKPVTIEVKKKNENTASIEASFKNTSEFSAKKYMEKFVRCYKLSVFDSVKTYQTGNFLNDWVNAYVEVKCE